MPRFLRQLGLFALVQLAVGLFLWSQSRNDASHYLAATVAKHNRLAGAERPKLVLVGGSNLAFGVDSTVLERRLPYEPVNMGLHVGLGLEYMLAEVLDDLKAGDIVVLSPEYHLFGSPPETLTQLQLLDHRPSNARYLYGTWKSVRELFDQWGIVFLGSIARRGVHGIQNHWRHDVDSGPYRSEAFNEFGDLVAHCNLPCKDVSQQTLFPAGYKSSHLQTGIAQLAQFELACRQRGVAVYYSFPPIPREQLDRSRPIIDEIDAAVRSELDIPVLERPEQISYAYDQFYDTPYHLNGTGRQQRTKQLADDLERQLVREAKLPAHRSATARF